MAHRRKLTKRIVDALSAAPRARQSYVWDDEVHGLALRLRAAGGRRWVFRYRFRGRQRFVVIGEPGQPWTVETARARAKVLQGQVAAGIDPATRREVARGTPTLEVAAERWIREHAEPHKAPASVAGDRFLLARLGVAFVDRPRGTVEDLGRTRVDAVTRDQVATLHRKLKGTPFQANRSLALLSAIFSWAGRVGGDNPCRGVRRYREERRARFLSPEELARLGATLAKVEDLNERGEPGGEGPIVVAAIRLLLFTGARLGELLPTRRDHVDVKAGTLRVDKPKEGRPKLIRLGEPALAVIRDLPRARRNPFLLPGHRRGRHIVNIEDAWVRIRARAKLEDVRLHDLRHSYASVVAAGGSSLPIIGALLGHRNPQTTQRYAHLGADPLRGVANAAARAIDQALKGKG